MSEILTQGTKELYAMFSLPIPSVQTDMDAIRVDASKCLDINELITYINGGDLPKKLIVLKGNKYHLNPSSS